MWLHMLHALNFYNHTCTIITFNYLFRMFICVHVSYSYKHAHAALTPDSCLRDAVSSLVVTNPVDPKSFSHSSSSSVCSRGVLARNCSAIWAREVGVTGWGVTGRGGGSDKERCTLSSNITFVGGGVGGVRSFSSSCSRCSSLAFFEDLWASCWILCMDIIFYTVFEKLL